VKVSTFEVLLIFFQWCHKLLLETLLVNLELRFIILTCLTTLHKKLG
jgi:hypothetical protein